MGLGILVEVVAAAKGEVVRGLLKSASILFAEIMMDVGLIYSSRDWARWLAPEQHVELAAA
jgi:hypothetical protein